MYKYFEDLAADLPDWLTPERRENIYRNTGPNVGWFVGGLFASIFLVTFIAALCLPAKWQPSLPLVYCLSVWGGVEAVLHRMGWWGRRLRPRLWLWLVLTLGFIGTAGFTLGAMLFQNIGRIASYADAIKALRAEPQSAGTTAQLAAYRLAAVNVDLRIYIDAIALLACLGLLGLTVMPASWASFRRFQLFLLALVTVLGRPLAGAVYSYFWSADPSAELLVALLFAPILMPLGGVIVLLALILTVGLCGAVVVFTFVTLPLLIYDFIEKRANKAFVRAQKKAGLESYLLRFDAWLRHDRLPYLPDESKGARFALPDEIRHQRQNAGFGFGHLDGDTLFLDTDKHVLLMASTRSGKGVTIIIPHLLRHEGSAFVLDPKGENARATGLLREMLNDAVHYLDPFGISGKPQSRFNPLASFTPWNMEAGSKALAAALVMNEKRDHWTASGQQLVAAVILHVVTSDSFPPEMKDLVTVRRLLLGAIQPTLEEMAQSAAADGLVADLAASFLATPPKEFGSIVSTAQRETEILDNPYIATCLAAAGEGSEVDFDEWHRGTMTVFLCLSAPKFPTFSRWLRLVLTSALDAMTDHLEPPPVPVCFMLDELATLGHLGVIENAVGLSAGYGIQLVAVFQDIAQMKDLYKGRWASFIGNAGVRILFSLDDYDTAKYWSDFLGGRLVGTRSESQDIYGLTKGQTAGETLRPLLSPEEIMLRYASGKMLILKQGMRPIEAERIPYWLDPRLAGLWRDPRERANHNAGESMITARAAK